MLSKKTQYALQALSYMVEKNSEFPMLIAEIAAAKNIPLKFQTNCRRVRNTEASELAPACIVACKFTHKSHR